jgi:hypothetical protein
VNPTSLSLLQRLRTVAADAADWQRLHDLYLPLIRSWLRQITVNRIRAFRRERRRRPLAAGGPAGGRLPGAARKPQRRPGPAVGPRPRQARLRQAAGRGQTGLPAGDLGSIHPLRILGCTLYFLLAGRPPFQEEGLEDLLQAHCTREAKRLDALRGEVPAELAAVVARMMAKNPAQRYPEPAAVVQALAPFVGTTLKPLPPAAAALGDAGARAPNAATMGGKPEVQREDGPDTVVLPTPSRQRWWWSSTRQRGRQEVRAPAAEAASGGRQAAEADTPGPRHFFGRLLGAAGGLALLVVLALWAGTVFRVKTPQGILVVEVNESNAEVFVDGDRVTVTWGKDGKTAEVRLKPGTHKVQVKKDGFTAHGEEVELQDGACRILTARLVPAAGKQAAAADKDVPRKSPEKAREDQPKKEPIPPPAPPQAPVEPPKPPAIAPPSQERAEAGSYFSDPNALPSILVQKEAEGSGGWRQLLNRSRVYTSDRLVSLPGYASEVRLDSGVRLLLRGHLPEFSDPQQRWMDFLLESAVVLHKNTVFDEKTKKAIFDADLTLDRGRLYVSNHKEEGPARVRLRFGKAGGTVWDLTLDEPGTEIGVDLLKQYTPRENYLAGADPRMELYLIVLRGTASLRIDADHWSNLHGAPQPSVFVWDNKGSGTRGPGQEPRVPPFWSKAPPPGKEADAMVRALKELSRKMVDVKQPPSVALQEVLQDFEGVPNSLDNRLLAIYCYCGLDDVRRLIDTLGDENPQHYIERDAAIFTLRRWLSRDAANSNRLYDAKTRTGVLTATPKYRSGEAQTIVQLLHDFGDEAQQSPETYQALAEYLTSHQVAIAELAIWQLRRLGLGAVKLPRFNAAQPQALREKAADEVRKRIDDGKLPPPSSPPWPPLHQK